jgi:hypothetical protein
MINFYRRFLPKIAATLRPLTDLLRGSPKVLEWSAAAAEAFQAAKSALVAAVPLSHPATISLAVDASDSHVPSHFFLKNSPPPRQGIPRLIVNCLLPTALSGISGSC